MKVRILQSCSGIGFSYSPGEVAEVDTEQGADLIKHGLAEALEAPAQTATAKAPKAQTARIQK